jgi:hypothetical protein
MLIVQYAKFMMVRFTSSMLVRLWHGFMKSKGTKFTIDLIDARAEPSNLMGPG